MQIESVQIEFLSCDEWVAPPEKRPKQDLIISKVSKRFSMVQNKSNCMKTRIVGGELLDVPKDGFILFPPQTMQYCCVPKEHVPSAHIRWLYLDVLINGKYSLTDLFELPFMLPEAHISKMNAHLDALSALKDDPNRLCQRLSVAYKIVQLLLDVAQPKPKMDSHVQKAVSYIRTYYSQPLTVSRLATVAGMSESNFFRAFKKQTGVSPVTYLNDYRLVKASVLLEVTKMRVGEIALQVGFKEQYYFSRLFLRRFGVSPLKYRKNTERPLLSDGN
ncbi:MAG: helix-turn-helix transcriptional regulator [Clostridia bacterium]|nr:helix-turn-helix transcriptional regulator [Clostridia bacterium]